jgi:hypothetical protein
VRLLVQELAKTRSDRLGGQERRRQDPVPGRRALRGAAQFTGTPNRANRASPFGQQTHRQQKRVVCGPRHHGAGQSGDGRSAGLGGGVGGRRRPGRGLIHRGRAAAGGGLIGESRPLLPRHQQKRHRETAPLGGPHHDRRGGALRRLLWINPPAFVAQVVAFAFGLAASSFFPIIVLGHLYQDGPPGKAASPV